MDFSLIFKEIDKARYSTLGILANYKTNISSLTYFFENFGAMAQSADDEQQKNLKDDMELSFNSLDIDREELESLKPADPDESLDYDKIGAVIEKSMNKAKSKSPNQLREFSEQLMGLAKQQYGGNFSILSRSSFLMLNNYFEYLLSDLLSYYYNKFQLSLNDKKFDLTLKEINEYDSIKDAIKAFITKEVESLIVELTFDKLLEHFDSKLKISNEGDIINWKVVTESRERRHLIVHNSSLVNKKYITRTGNPFKFKIGDTVYITKEYFTEVCNEFYLAGLLLCFNCVGNWDKEYITGAIYQIMLESVELINKNQFEIAYRLAEYAQKRIIAKNDQEEDILLRINFNRILALQCLGREELATKELQKIKVGTATPLFKLAHAVLSREYESVPDLVRQTEALDDISEHTYLDWPIYKRLHTVENVHEAIMAILKVEETGSAITIDEVEKPHKPTRRKKKN